MPSGVYYTKIINAKEKRMKDGRQAVEVCYQIQNAYYCSARMNGAPENRLDDKIYYIKQTYPIDSERCQRFADSMAEALGLEYDETFLPEDTIGITELAELVYYSGIDIGGFESRRPFAKNDFIDVSKDQTSDTEDDECEEECDESVPIESETMEQSREEDETVIYDAIDDDEEFDDFFEDIDDYL